MFVKIRKFSPQGGGIHLLENVENVHKISTITIVFNG